MRADTTSTPTPDPVDGPAEALPPLLLTAADLAQLLRLSTATVWRLRAAGKLPRPTAALGKQLVRWDRRTIELWVAHGMQPVAEFEALREAEARRNGRH
jgi:predicted DNA-binding transcriptional regulator AlpA